MENKEIKHRKTHLMQRRIFMVSEYQSNALKEISIQTGFSMSDLVRQGLQVTIREYANVIRKKD